MEIADAMTSVGETLAKENPIPQQETTTPVAQTTVNETPTEEVKPAVASTTEATPATTETPKPQEQKELTDDELLNLIQKRGIKLPEEKKKTEDEEEADFIAYGTKTGKLKVDDYVDAKKLKDIKDNELVFQEFASKLKAKDKHITQDKIQEKFNKKFGDEVLDETDSPKIVYDEDLISDEAKKIRDNKFSPINALKTEYGEVSKQERIHQQTEQEFSRDIAPQIADKVVVRHGNADYTIELDKPYLDHVKNQVKAGFQLFRQNPDQVGKQFDARKYQEFIVKTDKFDDIAEIIAKQRSDADVLEALKPFKNPVETDKQRDTTPQGGKTVEQAAAEFTKQNAQFRG